MQLNFNVFEHFVPSTNVIIILGHLARYFMKWLIMSVLVGLILTEKADQYNQIDMAKIKKINQCFICGGSRN